jgi:hypothetical protein
MGALPQAPEIIFERLSVESPTSLPYPFPSLGGQYKALKFSI